MKKTIILAVAVIAAMFVVSCNGNKTTGQKTDTDSLSCVESDSLQADGIAIESIAGTYEGTHPAADCPGIKTV